MIELKAVFHTVIVRLFTNALHIPYNLTWLIANFYKQGTSGLGKGETAIGLES